LRVDPGRSLRLGASAARRALKSMTAPPKPSPEALRRAEIRRRRKGSVMWTAVHILGSLNLAVVLLITIAGAIAFATIMESKFDTPVAAYYIYDAVWFDFWLLALALNLLCAAFTRWPWQRKHLGFVVTHAGIILLLLGAVIGKTLGFEAFVTLDKTKPPESRLFTKQNILTVETMNGVRWQMPINLQVHPPTPQRPLVLPVEGSANRLVVDRVSENLAPDDTLISSADLAAPGGVALRFLNAGMNQDVGANLTMTDDGRTFDFFGIAKIDMVDLLPEDQPIALPPATEPAPAAPRDDTPFRETQMVFVGAPPILDSDSDMPSGYSFKIETAKAVRDIAITVTGPGGASRTLALHDLERKWADLNGDGDPIHFRVAKFWPDFTMKNGQPVSISDQPNHPAALVQVTGPSRLLPPAPPQPAAAAVPLPKGLVMRVAMAKEPDKIIYELERGGKIEARGVAAQGDTIRLGWSKWVAKVQAVLPHAELHREVKELTGQIAPAMMASLRTGIHARVVAPDGTKGNAEWIPGGTARELFAGRDFLVRVGFGQRVILLPFNVALEDFKVPRDEGTDTPSDFISNVRFEDPASGRVARGTAHMNSPAMFPGDTWRSVLGWNYKFSQANWDPNNLDQTTLQVLYDPGWPFKWIGSLGICCGIALMFYFMPKRSAKERREDDSHAT
jgi:hypothetical protein